MNQHFTINKSDDKNIRLAVPEDYQEIWRLLMMSHKENGLFELDPGKVDLIIRRFIGIDKIPKGDFGPRGVIAVIGSIGNLEALAVVAIAEFWYTKQKMLEEFTIFVDPECRKSTHANKLIKWMKQQADEAKAPLLSGIISNNRTEAKCRLYGRKLPKVGEFFLYFGIGCKPKEAESG